MNRLVAEAMLEELGHRCHLMEDGAAALRLIEEQPVDVVLLDLHMPGMDGLETCRRLRRTRSPEDLPVLALTADAAEDSRERCLAAGMNGVILKPVRLEALSSVLAELEPARVERPQVG